MKKLISLLLLAMSLACAVSGCGPGPVPTPPPPTPTSMPDTPTPQLTATTPREGRCGDGVCNASEDAQSCPQDCAQSTPVPSPTDTPTPTVAPQVISPANANQVTLLQRLGQGALRDMAWLPGGQTIAASYPTGISLYDGETMVERQFLSTDAWSMRLAVSPDGHYLALVTDEGLQVWDVETTQLVHKLDMPFCGRHLALSPDGLTLAEGCQGYDSVVRLWDVSSGKIRLRLAPLSQGLSGLAFSPDGQTLVTSSGRDYADPDDTPLRFWDVETGEALPVEGDLSDAPSSVGSLVYSPDGRLLAGRALSEVYVWDAVGGMKVQVLDRRAATLAFSPDSKLLAWGSSDDIATIWDVSSGHEVLTIQGHSDDVIRVAFSPLPLADTGVLLLGTATARDGVQLWDVATGQRVAGHTTVGHTNSVEAAAFSPDGRLLATGSTDETVWLWDAASGQPQRVLTAPRAGDGTWPTCFWSLGFSPDGTTLAAGSTDAAVRLWDVARGELVRVLEDPMRLVHAVAYSPDGRLLAAGDTPRLWLWDVASGELLYRVENPPTTLSVSFSPEGQMLATGNGFGWIRLWDVDSGELLREMKASNNSAIAVFSPDGQTLASGSSGFAEDYAVRLWDVASGEVLHTLEGHTADVKDLVFSPDGRILVSCDRDGIIRLWDVATAQQVQALEQEWGVNTVAFSPDGGVLATGGFDHLVRLWGVRPGE
jgi:WD40 repeat protein